MTTPHDFQPGNEDAALRARIETALVTRDMDYKDMILRQCLAAVSLSRPNQGDAS